MQPLVIKTEMKTIGLRPTYAALMIVIMPGTRTTIVMKTDTITRAS